MPFTTVDLALFHIARIRRLLSEPALKRLLERSEKEAVSFETLLREKGVPREAVDAAVEARDFHGRVCRRCNERTFLMPGQTDQNTQCEHCGGELVPRGTTTRRARPPAKPDP